MLPSKAYARGGPISISLFKGLNRRVKAETGEFFDMENMGHGDYPCLSSIKNPSVFLEPGFEIIKYMVPKYAPGITGFCGIVKKDDGKFALYVGGEEKKTFDEYSDCIDFNGAFMVFPAFQGYNYVMQSSYESDKTISGAILSGYTVNIRRNWETKTGSLRVSATLETVTGKLSEGLSVVFSGFTDSLAVNNTIFPQNSVDYSNLNNPVSITVKSIKKSSGSSDSNPLTEIEFIMRNAKGDQMMPFAGGQTTDGSWSEGVTGVKVSAYIPKISHICAAQNRLWACDASGERINISALGRPVDFLDLGTSSAGSWYGDVGTPGLFTGIIGHQNRVLAFKEDYIHVVYGSMPEEYSIEKSYTTGCIDGKSIAITGNMVIWLYHDGFYAYTGGVPKRISDKLNTRYVSATAFTDNTKYYARCVKEDGGAEFLIYDTEYGFWTKIKDFPVLGGEFYGGKVYAYDSAKVYELGGGEYGDFYAETTEMTLDTFDDKSAIYLNIRCRMDKGAFINVYTSSGGEWTEHKGIDSGGKHKLPVRYAPGDVLKLRIEGHGRVCVEDMEIEIRAVSC